MATNYVELKIKATDTAKPDLTGLKAQLDELGSKVESAKVDVDDTAGTATLLDINAKLAALNAKVASPKISVAGAARAQAQIAALGVELDRMGQKSETADVHVRVLRERLMALRDTAGSVVGVSDAFAAFNGEASKSERIFSGISLATGLLEAPVAGLIVGVGGLASGLVTAGIGMAAFGAVAKSAISNVTPAVTAYETAINTSGKAAKTAMTQYQQYMAALSGPQREMAKSLIGAEGAWQKFVSSNTSGVSKILSQGIGLLPGILQTIQPMLAPVESALSGVVKMISTSMKSSGFIEFFAGIDAYAGPSISKLAIAIKNVVGGIGGILQAFMPMSQSLLGGLDKITGKFETWGQTLTSHSGFKSLVEMVKADMPNVITIIKNLGGAFAHLGSSMTGLSTFSNSEELLKLAVPFSQILDKLTGVNPAFDRFGLYAFMAADGLRKMAPAFQGIKAGFDTVKGGVGAFQKLRSGFSDAETAASDASGVWGTFGGKLSTALSSIKQWGIWSKIASIATRAWTGIQLAFDAAMDANPIALIVIAIIGLAAIITLLVLKCKPFRQFWISMWGDVEKAATKAWQFLDKSVFKPIQKGVDALVSFVKAHWKTLATILATVLLGPVGGLVVFLATHWRTVVRDVQTCVNTVKSWFERLPGLVMSAISSLPGKLFSFGGHIISMLANGIKSAIGDVTSAVGSVASEILSHIPMSPAKKGPLSGRGDPKLGGARIGAYLAQGLAGSTGVVSQAASRVAKAASVSGMGTAAGAATGGAPKLQLEIVGSDSKFMTALMNQVRITGGDPAMFQKKVAYR